VSKYIKPVMRQGFF